MWKQNSGAFFDVKGKKCELISNYPVKNSFLQGVKDKKNDIFYLSGSVIILNKFKGITLSYDNAVILKDYLIDMTITDRKVKRFEDESKAVFNFNNKKYIFDCQFFNTNHYVDYHKEEKDLFRIKDIDEVYLSYNDAMKLKDYLIEIIADTEKELNKSKEYSFSEMIKEYENGYRGKFERINSVYSLILELKGGRLLISKGIRAGDEFPISIGNLKSKYIKVKEPVIVEKELTIEEGLKAFNEGKEIYFKTPSSVTSYEKTRCTSINVKHLLLGKCYIETEE